MKLESWQEERYILSDELLKELSVEGLHEARKIYIDIRNTYKSNKRTYERYQDKVNKIDKELERRES